MFDELSDEDFEKEMKSMQDEIMLLRLQRVGRKIQDLLDNHR